MNPKTNISKVLMIFCLWICSFTGYSQFYNCGTNIFIGAGTSLKVNGNFKNMSTGGIDATINNAGNIFVTGNWFNNTSGTVFINLDTSGKVFFISDSIQIIGGTSSTAFENIVFTGMGAKIIEAPFISARGFITLNAILKLNHKKLIIENADPSALTFTGKIISEGLPADGYGTVQWNTGTGAGTYTLPFATETGETIPVTFTITQSSSDNGYITFATYKTDSLGLPLPTGVSNAENPQQTVDRYWIIDLQNYTILPKADIQFTYQQSEVTGAGNSIDETKLKAAYFNSSNGSWHTFTEPVSTDITTNKLTVNNINNEFQNNVWTLREANADTGSSCSTARILPPATYTCSGINFQITDTVFWMRFTADTTSMRIAIQNPTDKPAANIQKLILYSGDCGNLQEIARKDVNAGDLLDITKIDLVIGDTYFAKAVQTQAAIGWFRICNARISNPCVYNPILANAGQSVAIQQGQNANLGTTSVSGMTYNWSPEMGLSSTNISNPIATPNVTTTYYVTMTDANGCSDADAVVITVGNQTGNVSPNGIFDNVLDQNGNQYKLSDLMIAQRAGANGMDMPKSILICATSGYFNLWFETGCGMEGTGVEAARREVICQLFSDLSAFIESPCDETGQKVNIWIRNIANVPNIPSGVAALASPFYVVAGGASGIVDNEVWKTINSGIDSYFNFGSPLTTQSGGGFFHGYMAFDFSPAFNNYWNTSLTNPTLPIYQMDLYSIALHEAAHALGFVSLIDQFGQSKLPAGFDYYTRYDLNLKTPLYEPLITNTGNCNLYDYQFNENLIPSELTSPDPFNCSTHILYSSTSVNQAVFSPSTFSDGSSLSHFEDQCPDASQANDAYFVMSETGVWGLMKRYLKPEERLVLCDIGYKVNTTYGSSVNHNDYDYNTSQCPGTDVVGINDGITSTYTWAYTLAPSASIIISDILDNDYTVDAVPPTSFECLEVVFGGGTAIPNAGTIFTYNSGSNPGIVLLRYVPVYNGQRGNITYIYIKVKSGNCSSCANDLVSNGNFESTTCCGEVNTQCGSENPTYTATVDCWNQLFGSVDIYATICTKSGFQVGVNTSGTQPPTNSIDNLDHFIGLASSVDNSIRYTEIFNNELSSPLIPGTVYVLSFNAKVNNWQSYPPQPSNNSAYLFFGSTELELVNIPYNDIWYGTSFQNLTYINPLPNQTQISLSSGDENWHSFNIQFTFNGTSPHNNLIVASDIFQQPLSNEYYDVFIDNISIQPAATAVTFTPETLLCLNEVITDLNDYANPPGGTFSGTGIIGNSFDATTAGVGLHHLIYTYTQNGCSIQVFKDVVVVNFSVASLTTNITNVTCPGGSNGAVTVIPTGGTSPFTYIWNTNPVQTTAAIAGITDGPYSVTVTDANGCTASDNIIVASVNPQPTANAGNDQSVCAGQTTTLTASGGTSYIWNNGITQGTAFTPTATDTYTVTVTDAFGCTASDAVTVTVNPLPVANAGSDQSINSGQSVTLSASGGTSYAWNNGVTDGVAFTPSVTDIYTVTVTDANNCTATDAVIVTVIPLPIVTATPASQSICSGNTTGITLTSDIIGTSYSWTVVQSTGISGASNGSGNIIAQILTNSGTSAGTATYTVTPTANNVQGNALQIVITVNTLPVASFSVDCPVMNSSTQLTNNSVNASSYLWDFGDGTTSTLNTPSNTFTDFGYYCVKLTVTNLCGPNTYSNSVYIAEKICQCNFSYTYPNDITLTSTILPDNSTIGGTITVASSATLTLNGNYFFGPKGRIIVSQFAKLIIKDNSRLTCLQTCTGMWQGIEVWGNKNASSGSSIQGNINLGVNVTIENAHIAVLLGKRNNNYVCSQDVTPGIFDLAFSGGTIIAYNPTNATHFNQNGHGIKFTYKSNANANTNVIKSNNFVCNGALLDPHYDSDNINPYTNSNRNPWVGPANKTGRSVKAIEVNHLYLSELLNINVTNHETGIESNNSSFFITKGTMTNCFFGIKINNTSSFAQVAHTIDAVKFNNTVPAGKNIGIYCSGGISDIIKNCNFNDIISNQANNYTGIYLTGSKLYNIGDNNTFNNYVFGIYIVSTPMAGYIGGSAGNKFNNCRTGINTREQNTQLQMRCNTVFIDPTILNQNPYTASFANTGWLANQSSQTNPAGNEFRPPTNPDYKKITSVLSYQINSMISVNARYRYYRHSKHLGVTEDVNNNSLVPSPVYVYVHNTNIEKTSASCSSGKSLLTSSGEQLRVMDSLKNSIIVLEQQKEVLLQHADNGQTLQTLAAINGSMSQGNLKNLLIANSPLSDTSIITLLNLPNRLSNGNFKNVMEVNLPVSEKVELPFNNKLDLLPTGIANQLIALQGNNPGITTTAKLQSQINFLTIYRNEIMADLLNKWSLADSTDAIIAMLSGENTPEANQLLVATLLEKGDYAQATSLYNIMIGNINIPSDWMQITGILLDLYSAGNSIYDMDSAQVQTMRDIAYSPESSYSGAYARSVLYILFNELIIIEQGNTSRFSNQNNSEQFVFNEPETGDSESFLGECYPNPFNGSVTISYTLPTEKTGIIKVHDVNGNLTGEYPLEKGSSVINIKTAKWSSGVYIYTMEIDGTEIAHRKMVLIK